MINKGSHRCIIFIPLLILLFIPGKGNAGSNFSEDGSWCHTWEASINGFGIDVALDGFGYVYV